METMSRPLLFTSFFFLSLLFSCNSKNELHVLFSSVDGLTEGDPLLFQKKAIGTITHMKLNDDQKIDVTIRLSTGVDFPAGSKFIISSRSTAAGKAIELQPGRLPGKLSAGEAIGGISEAEAAANDTLQQEVLNILKCTAAKKKADSLLQELKKLQAGRQQNK